MRTIQERLVDVIEWQRVPLSLWAICALLLIEALAIAFTASGPVVLVVVTIPVALVWCFFLLRGVRLLWFATLLVSVLAIPGALLGSVSWHIGLTCMGLLLLLLPSTRIYFSIGDPMGRHRNQPS